MKRRTIEIRDDEARHKKRSSDRKYQAAKTRFLQFCKECASDFASHDAYIPTAEQLDAWTGTIHADNSEIHRQIDAQSRAPHTRAAFAKELLRIHEDPTVKTKYDTLFRLASFKQPVEELRIVSVEDDEDNVVQELKEACSTPICFSQRPRRNLSIQDLVRLLSRHENAEIDVYDPSVRDDQSSTRKTTVEEFTQSFSEKGHSETAIPKNFLDISNSTGIQFLPQSVLDICLETRCRRGVKRVGKDSEEDTAEKNNLKAPSEFFIATKKGGISPVHVDNFGKATCVIMLVGTKCWYIPSGDAAAIRRDHRVGEVSPGSQQLKIKLDVGTVFIQLPGQIHRVLSETDCLMVGAHFYTAATFDKSLNCVCEQLLKGIHSNEDATSKDWSTLNTIIQFLNDREVFDEKESAAAYDSLEDLMNHSKLQAFWRNPPPSTKTAIKDFHATAKTLLKQRKALEG